ncbi:MAG: nucleotide exchange factor GrpE [Planctomycetales bacterium]|nr:nucleotide exchange factor GrpE [Planctomycetales bacterium]
MTMPPEHDSSLNDDDQTPDSELGNDAESQSVDDALADFGEASEPGERSEDPVRALQQQLDEANQRALRVQADLENYRKRARREIEDERKYATMPLLRELLPVIDNLGRAIETTQSDDQAEGVLQGVKMVAEQLKQVLANHRCCEIPARGEPFDPMWHEAIAEMPSEDHPPGTVTEVAQTGYRLHDRVIRPSQVIVSKKS